MAKKQNPKAKEREFIVECIRLYRELPSLWNIKSHEYRESYKKKLAYETLLSKYKEMYPDASKDDVKKKINSLRTNYRKELKKHLQSLKYGSSSDDIYQPTLWYFNDMLFLNDHESVSDSQSSVYSLRRKSKRSSLDSDYTQEDSISTADVTPTSSYEIPMTKRKSLKRKLADGLTQLSASCVGEQLDEYQIWALSCAADLKKMDPLQQIFAKNAVAAILMEGQLGLLHRDSVKINKE